MIGGEDQLFLVRPLGEAGVQNRDHCDTTRTKSSGKIAIHRVFVEVDLEAARFIHASRIRRTER